MITITAEARAAQVAQNFGNTANNIAKQWPEIKANGLPAQGNLPAVTGAQVQVALGAASLAILDAIATANPQN